MKQGMLIYLLIGAVATYFLIGFVNKLHDENDALVTREKADKKADLQYYKKDVVGQSILVLPSGLSMKKKLGIWHRSPLFLEFIDLFPNFSEMESFVTDRIADHKLKALLLTQVDRIEDDFFSGRITEEEAKRALNR